jgi:hypothetical protein
MHINLKKTAVVISAAGLSLGLVGMGVGTSFTDGGIATENISVGNFAITLTSTTTGAVVVNSGNGVHTVRSRRPGPSGPGLLCSNGSVVHSVKLETPRVCR